MICKVDLVRQCDIIAVLILCRVCHALVIWVVGSFILLNSTENLHFRDITKALNISILSHSVDLDVKCLPGSPSTCDLRGVTRGRCNCAPFGDARC